jgi:hypothetical protein
MSLGILLAQHIRTNNLPVCARCNRQMPLLTLMLESINRPPRAMLLNVLMRDDSSRLHCLLHNVPKFSIGPTEGLEILPVTIHDVFVTNTSVRIPCGKVVRLSFVFPGMDEVLARDRWSALGGFLEHAACCLT